MNCTATTATGNACRAQAIRGSTPPMCSAHIVGSRIGRPGRLDEGLTDRLTQMLRAGNYLSVACMAVGISRETFRHWMNRSEPEYVTFQAAVDRARAEGEARHVTIIAKAATENWQAAAWLLERHHPDRWARPAPRVDYHEADVLAGGPAPTPVDPLDAIDVDAQVIPLRRA